MEGCGMADNSVQQKSCTLCLEIKPIAEFYCFWSTNNRPQARCKECTKLVARQRLEKQRSGRLCECGCGSLTSNRFAHGHNMRVPGARPISHGRQSKFNATGEKLCTDCQEVKPVSEFYQKR